MSDYFRVEAERRQPQYRHDDAVEAVLRDANRALDAHVPGPRPDRDRPTVLVVGLPRSGTTVLYQLLCFCLDVGYPDNVVARFWDAPHVGIALSKALLGEQRDASFRSTYGQTPLAGPHEFRFFWQRWLGLETMDDHLEFGPDHPKADWDGLAAAVRSMQAAFGKPVVFKSLYFPQFLPGIVRAVPQPLVVQLDRDPAEVALSILAARRAYYGDTETWWSSFPPDYREIAELPFDRQIAHQVVGLRRLIDGHLADLDERLVVRIGYQQLCAEPATVVAAVRERLLATHGIDVPLVNQAPDALVREPRVETDAAGEAVLAALATLERA